MRATFDPGSVSPHTSILRWAEGKVITPFASDGKRVVLIIDDEDFSIFNGLRNGGAERVVVTDQMTGEDHALRSADCGLGCHCAAEIVSNQNGR